MIRSRMAGQQGLRHVHSSLLRAQSFAARLSHRLRTLEPFDGSQPGVVITGAAGMIGTVLRTELADGYALRTVDRRPGAGVDLAVDVRRSERMASVVAGAEAVVELAANSSVSTSWRRVLENNLAATVGTLEAARRAGVPRVVVASSNHVTGIYERDEPYASVLAGRYEGLDPDSLHRIRADSPPRPDSFYAVGKCGAEAAARYYAEEHGLSVICLRIGTVNRENRPRNPREFATLLTHRDLAQLVRRCLEAPLDLRFAVFYGVSQNTWRIWDIDDAASAIGYQPLDDSESFRRAS
jgi:nucleoside-diphosphate-sugar epimerase